jgi:hypothetical protein
MTHPGGSYGSWSNPSVLNAPLQPGVILDSLYPMLETTHRTHIYLAPFHVVQCEKTVPSWGDMWMWTKKSALPCWPMMDYEYQQQPTSNYPMLSSSKVDSHNTWQHIKPAKTKHSAFIQLSCSISLLNSRNM